MFVFRYYSFRLRPVAVQVFAGIYDCARVFDFVCLIVNAASHDIVFCCFLFRAMYILTTFQHSCVYTLIYRLVYTWRPSISLKENSHNSCFEQDLWVDLTVRSRLVLGPNPSFSRLCWSPHCGAGDMALMQSRQPVHLCPAATCGIFFFGLSWSDWARPLFDLSWK